MITRNFYRLDEVESSLVWCIVHQRVEESMFWCLELIESGLGIYALQILWKSYIYFIGIGSLSWFENALAIWNNSEIQEDTILLLCYQLATLPPESRDCTPFCLLILGLQQYKSPPNYITGSLHNKSVFQKSVLQGKLELSWQFLKSDWESYKHELEILVPTEFKSHFQSILTLQEILEIEFPTDITLISGALALCFTFVFSSKKFLTLSKKSLKPEISDFVTKKILDWKEISGKRKRRIFSPPLDCLAWITQRGRKSCYFSNLQEIREIWKYIDHSVPCWEDVDFTMDSDSYDDTMDFYFPDDIPDEWSAEDQKKSHGNGVLQKNEKPNYSKFLKKWLRFQTSKLLWKASKKSCDLAIQLFENKQFYDFDPDFQTYYKNSSTQIQVPLKPVVIRFQLQSNHMPVLEQRHSED